MAGHLLAALLASDNRDAVAALSVKYGVEMDQSSTARLVADHGLVVGPIE
jgi:hypothetical protein